MTPCPAITPARHSLTTTPDARSAARNEARGACSISAAARAAPSTCSAPATPTSSGWARRARLARSARPSRTRRPVRDVRRHVACRSPTAAFELVYCKQVLEHVRRPEPLLAEVRRVLVPGGWFAGSTSQLELYHSLSMWNYTPFGDRHAARGGRPKRGRAPPRDRRLTLIAWRVAGGHPFFHRWWGRESPFNRAARRLRANRAGRHAHAEPNQAAVLRAVRIPGPPRAESHGDRHRTGARRAHDPRQPARPPQSATRRSRPITGTSANGRAAARRQACVSIAARCCRWAPGGTPGVTCSRRRPSGWWRWTRSGAGRGGRAAPGARRRGASRLRREA